jgi:hypothetical protein
VIWISAEVKVGLRATLWGYLRTKKGWKKEKILKQWGYRYPIKTRVARSMALLRDAAEQGRIA